MNTVLIIDKNKFFYISKFLNKFENINNFNDRLSIMLKIFEQVYFERKAIKSSIFNNYLDEFMKSFHTKKVQANYRLNQLFIYAFELYHKFFINDEIFLLHGDLRFDNILKDNDRLIAIDPIGICAPIEFEFTRFIEDEIFNCENFHIFEKKLCFLLFSLSQLKFDCLKLLYAIFIDSVYRTSLSVLRDDSIDDINRGIKNGEWLVKIILKDSSCWI